jgi:hypothetical protein
MNAQLKASAYREGKSEYSAFSKNAGEAREKTNDTITSLSGLRREYDLAARTNFAREAPFLGLVTAIGFIWPLSHAIHALLS